MILEGHRLINNLVLENMTNIAMLLFSGQCSPKVEVHHSRKGTVYVRLYLWSADGTVCVNDELCTREYAAVADTKKQQEEEEEEEAQEAQGN